jgi:hypothetical protein
MLCHVAHRALQSTEAHLPARRGHGRHETHRIVLEHSRRLTRRVSHDRAAFDVTGLTRDLRCLQRERVGEVHVAVEPIDPYRIVRRDRIDPRPLGQLATPVRVVPVAVENPRAGGDGTGEVADPGDELRLGSRVAQLHGRQREAAVEEVDVRIHEAGDHHHPSGVHRPGRGARSLLHLGARSHGVDAFAADQHGVGPGPPRVAGPDPGVDDGERLDRSGRGGERRGSGLLHGTGEGGRDESQRSGDERGQLVRSESRSRHAGDCLDIRAGERGA